MSEADWPTSADPLAMLQLVHDQGQATDRKLRLFIVACCYRLGLPDNDAIRFGLEVAARLTEAGGVKGMKAHVVLPAGRVTLDCGASEPLGLPALNRGLNTLENVSLPWILQAAIEQLSCSRDLSSGVAWGIGPFQNAGLPLAQQADLLRELFAAPGRKRDVNPEWLLWERGTIPAMGECTYQEHDLIDGTLAADRLAVLSDALEDAGCTDAELLSHLRSPGPHRRGCWALDYILNKE